MLVIIYIRDPSEFTSFPTLLLIVTLFRLGLNIATTRLILGEAQAGQIIQKFGEVVVQNNYVVGFVVFIILTVINFVVITKGAGRIAEVAARFTLDAMPGKQMAIDAELNAGLIKEDQARKRRDALSKETDFYGSMDGASKFVRGDAIAGIIITLVNIVGGIGIGVMQRGMDVSQALQTYTILRGNRDWVHFSRHHMEAELTMHAKYIKKYIIAHDTSISQDPEKESLYACLYDFCREAPGWDIIEREIANVGYTVLKRK